MRCTAKAKDGADLLAQLRAAQPMPRGERLATWSERAGIRCCRAEAAARWALARERRRRERAEELADERRAAMHRAWVDEQATSAMFHERGREIDALRAEVERLKARLARERERSRRKQLRGRAWWCPSTDMERAASALRAAHISARKPMFSQRERAWRENWQNHMDRSKAHRIAAHAAGQGVPR